MDFYSLFILASGLSLFLYGMQRSEKGLKLLAGERTRHLVDVITRNRVVGMFAGLVLTFGTQSSSATTVMLVGFATAGLITLSQSIGVLLGTAMGTTVTVQLFAWKVTRIAPVLISVGFLLYATGRGTRRRRAGQLILGFGLVFLGMTFMGEAVEPLRDSALFAQFLRAVDSRVGLLLLSAVFTAIVQSSAATIAVVIALAGASTGADGAILTVEKAVPLILGANIGTSATALIASIGSNGAGRQVAWAHAVYKTVAAVAALPLTGLLVQVGQMSAPGRVAAQIANIHTAYNVAAAVVFLPLTGLLARSVAAVVKDKPEKREGYQLRFIDRDFTEHPYLALAQAGKEIVRMSGVVTGMLEKTWEALVSRDANMPGEIKKEDDKVDFLHEHISPYLTAVSEDEMHPEETRRQTMLLAITSELELVGDVISKDICGSVSQLLRDNLSFSDEGMRDMRLFYERVRVNLYSATNAFAGGDRERALQVVKEKEAVDALQEQLRSKHFERLKAGLPESLETTTIHLDIMEDLRRINSHAARICAIMRGHSARGAMPLGRKADGSPG